MSRPYENSDFTGYGTGGIHPTGPAASTSGYQNQNVEHLRSQVDEVTGIMKQNMNKVIERDGHLNEIMERAENMSDSAVVFRDSSKKVSRKMWWENCRMRLLCAGIVTVIVAVVVIIILFSTGVINTGGGSTTTAKPPVTKQGP